MTVCISTILSRIESDFARTYKNASPFVHSGELWNFCISVISDPMKMNNIIFANDLGIPPVKALLQIYAKTVSPAPDFRFSEQQSQWLGSMMGFVFKKVLQYKRQEGRITVNRFGVGSATRFLDAPDEIEIIE